MPVVVESASLSPHTAEVYTCLLPLLHLWCPQEDSRVILAQKYADGGDLLKALHHAGGRLTEHSAVSMVIQPLLSCMVYLHGKGIIHR